SRPFRSPLAGVISPANPMGTDGFEFLEFTGPDIAALETAFRGLGFAPVARHRAKAVTQWRQGEVNLIINAEPDSFAAAFARVHGASASAMAFRVADAPLAHARAVALGARPVAARAGPMELNIPAIEGIGGSLLYFVDRYGARGSIYDVDFHAIPGADPNPAGNGLVLIEHLSHGVHRGRLDDWSSFYSRLFNFQALGAPAAGGAAASLASRAITSPCGQIRISIDEGANAGGDEAGRVAEYLRAYRGEGIRRVGLLAADIDASAGRIRAAGIRLADTPAGPGGGLPRLITEPLVGPIFFELIERKGEVGIGEDAFLARFAPAPPAPPAAPAAPDGAGPDAAD
ncbi:MAG: hypothetical protein IT555_04985, partial [Acetobacteraceae bacterium]|nr:hypothetical protein [Acetobacteraceae bacterium]